MIGNTRSCKRTLAIDMKVHPERRHFGTHKFPVSLNLATKYNIQIRRDAIAFFMNYITTNNNDTAAAAATINTTPISRKAQKGKGSLDHGGWARLTDQPRHFAIQLPTQESLCLELERRVCCRFNYPASRLQKRRYLFRVHGLPMYNVPERKNQSRGQCDVKANAVGHAFFVVRECGTLERPNFQ